MRTAMATKFVAWEVPTLEALKGSKVYILREKLNNGGQMNREEKDWLTENVNSNTYFKSAVPLHTYEDRPACHAWDSPVSLHNPCSLSLLCWDCGNPRRKVSSSRQAICRRIDLSFQT